MVYDFYHLYEVSGAWADIGGIAFPQFYMRMKKLLK
jgi:hypothetical protein